MSILLMLVIRKHHGDTIPERKIVPSDIKPFAALIGPDRADARPDLLAVLVFARGLAVVEDIGWRVWHGV